MMNRRSAVAALAAAVAAPLALATIAHAQTTAPGMAPSTTAPSNSEGTPSSATGVIGTTRVAPPVTTAAPTTTTTTHRRRRHRRHATTTTTTPQ